MIYYKDKSLERFSKAQIKVVSELYGEAFLNHSKWKKVVLSESRRRKVLTHLFHILNKIANKYGDIIVVCDDDIEIGYITLVDIKDAKFSLGQIIKSNALFTCLKFLFSLKINELLKFNCFNNDLKNAYKNIDFKEKTMHLLNAGIKPEYKGQGYMSKWFRKLRVIYNDFDEILLETSESINELIYSKVGFEVVYKKNNVTYMKLDLR
ncbi:hypothetical protein KHQ82_10305 [Mycoplasmatota bacterium]|nr:hypothetical protein KHQ82_10305 [Mycoplasmatota bacterium]